MHQAVRQAGVVDRHGGRSPQGEESTSACVHGLGTRRGAWRPVYLLVHPDGEAPAAHDTNRDDRPYQDRKHRKNQKLEAPRLHGW
jgi:hypothetical protein